MSFLAETARPGFEQAAKTSTRSKSDKIGASFFISMVFAPSELGHRDWSLAKTPDRQRRFGSPSGVGDRLPQFPKGSGGHSEDSGMRLYPFRIPIDLPRHSAGRSGSDCSRRCQRDGEAFAAFAVDL